MSIVVKYGSTTRGDTDCFSDCDLLIVGKSSKKFENRNYDIVRYTKNRLINLYKNNSLFLVHLRDEGVIVEDENSWMENFLKKVPDYIPSKISLQLSKQNLSIAASLTPTKPLLECWYDIIFVFLRDYLVKLNALNKKYVFSIDKLLDYIELENKNELKTILKICREIKFRYRNEIKQDIFINHDWASNILRKALSIETNKHSFEEIITNSVKFDQYLILRLVEYKLAEGSVKVNNPNIWKFIKKPSLYSWDIRNINWINEVEIVEPGAGEGLGRGSAFLEGNF